MEYYDNHLYEEGDKHDKEKSIGTLTSWQMLAKNVALDEPDAEHDGSAFDDDESESHMYNGKLQNHLSNLRSPSFFCPRTLSQDESKSQLVTPKQHHILYKEYRVLNEIGSGAFGRVCLARRLSDGKEVVVKEIKTSQLSGKIKATTMDEVQVLASLNHPNIVKFHDCFMDDSYINIVMEYCNAGDLAKLLKSQNKQTLPEHHIMFLFVQICLALNCTHTAGVLHRDLKTGNCMLTKPSNIANSASIQTEYINMPLLRLGDFGVAKVTGADASVSSTVVGTPQYMTPEMIDNKPYGRKSDVWALGCILYEMCTLKKAFEADRIPMIFQKIALGQYHPLPAPSSQDMKDLVAKLLSREAADRPTVQEVLGIPFVRNHLLLYLEWARSVPEAQIQALLSGLGDAWMKAVGFKSSTMLAQSGLSCASSTSSAAASTCSPKGPAAAAALSAVSPAAKPSALLPASCTSNDSATGTSMPALSNHRSPASVVPATAAPALAPNSKGGSFTHQSSEKAKALFSGLPSTASLHARPSKQQQPPVSGAAHIVRSSATAHPSPLVTSSSLANSYSTTAHGFNGSCSSSITPARLPSAASAVTNVSAASTALDVSPRPPAAGDSSAATAENQRANSTSYGPGPQRDLVGGLTSNYSAEARASCYCNLAMPAQVQPVAAPVITTASSSNVLVTADEAGSNRRSTSSSIVSPKPEQIAGRVNTSFEIWGKQLQSPASVSTTNCTPAATCTAATAATAADGRGPGNPASPFAAVQDSLLQEQHLLESEAAPGGASSVGAHVVVSVVSPGKEEAKSEIVQLKEMEAQIQQYLANALASASPELAESLAAAAAAVTAKQASLVTALSNSHQLMSSSSPCIERTLSPAAAIGSSTLEATARLPAVSVGRSSRSFTEPHAKGAASRRSTKEALSRATTTGSIPAVPGQSFEQWLSGDTSLLQRLQQAQLAESASNAPSSAHSAAADVVLQANKQEVPSPTTPQVGSGQAKLPTPRQTTSTKMTGTHLDVHTPVTTAQPQQQTMSDRQQFITVMPTQQLQELQLCALTRGDECPSSPLCKAALDATATTHPSSATQQWVAQLPPAGAAVPEPGPSPSASTSVRCRDHSNKSFGCISTITETAQSCSAGKGLALQIGEASDTSSTTPTAEHNSSAANTPRTGTASGNSDQTAGEAAMVKEQQEMLRLLKAFKSRMLSSKNHCDQQPLLRTATGLSICSAANTVSGRHVVDGLNCRSGNKGNGSLVATRWGPHFI